MRVGWDGRFMRVGWIAKRIGHIRDGCMPHNKWIGRL